MIEDVLSALCLPFHYYCFDGLGFPFMCLHLFRHVLYFWWIDFQSCLYIYIYIYKIFLFSTTIPISVKVKMPVENETVQKRLIFEDNRSNTDGNSFGTI